MKQTLQLGALSAANIGIAFLFQWYVITQLGPGLESDALFAGMTIPQLVLAVISGSLIHVLVPILAGESEERLRHNAWSLLVLVGGVFGVLAVLLYVAAPWWVAFTVPGFDEAGKTLTVELTRIQLIGMVFTAINGVQWAAYHAKQQFLWAEFTPILASTFALLLLVWALPHYGVIAAAWIGSLRMALQTLLLSLGMGKPVRPSLKSLAIQQAWHRIKPLLLGTAYYKTDQLIDRFLLSTASSGSLSLYYLGQQIFGAANQVLNKAIVAPLVPMLSKLYKAGDTAGFKRAYRRKLIQMAGISLFSLLILGFFGQYLLSLLVGYGKLSSQNLELLWLMMLLMSGQFAIGNLGMIMTAMFYSVGDTKSPTIVGVVAYTLGVTIKILMFYYAGALGLALGVTIYFIISLSLMAQKIHVKKYV